MTVKTFKYLGPKQQQVLRELADGWELWDTRPPSFHRSDWSRTRPPNVSRLLVNGLVERGLVRFENLDPRYVHRFGWVLTVRGKLEVEKMTKKGKR